VETYELVRASRIAFHARRYQPASQFVWTVKRRTLRSGTKQFYTAHADALLAAIRQRQATIAELEAALVAQQRLMERQRGEWRALQERQVSGRAGLAG
jgi:hypothetical protein